MVKVGDPLRVKVVEIDGQGRVNLSHKATLPGFEDMPMPQRGERRPTNGFGGDRRPGGPGDRRGPGGPGGPRGGFRGDRDR